MENGDWNPLVAGAQRKKAADVAVFDMSFLFVFFPVFSCGKATC